MRVLIEKRCVPFTEAQETKPTLCIPMWKTLPNKRVGLYEAVQSLVRSFGVERVVSFWGLGGKDTLLPRGEARLSDHYDYLRQRACCRGSAHAQTLIHHLQTQFS